MSLIINQSITTKDGFTVTGDTMVKFETIFPVRKNYEVHYNMSFYRNQASYDNGDKNYLPQNMNSMGHVETVSFSAYTGLTPTTVHVMLKDYLLTIFTGGTIDITI